MQKARTFPIVGQSQDAVHAAISFLFILISCTISVFSLFCLQEAHSRQVQELLAFQDAVSKERTRLGSLQNELKAMRAEVIAQVCLVEVFHMG